MAGLNAFGTTLSRGDGAPTEVFTAIAQVTNISGPGMERNTIDVTDHGSPDGWMEFTGGLKDAGEVEVEVNYSPSVHDVLAADFEDEDPRNYKLAFPDGTTWSFAAILTGFEPEAPVDDKLAATLTFKVSGKPTLGSGT